MAHTTPKTAVPIVFGAMTLGNGSEQSHVYSLQDCAEILSIFQSHGHSEIDTTRFYSNGSSEEYFGKFKWQDRGLVMDTKLFPL